LIILLHPALVVYIDKKVMPNCISHMWPAENNVYRISLKLCVSTHHDRHEGFLFGHCFLKALSDHQFPLSYPSVVFVDGLIESSVSRKRLLWKRWSITKEAEGFLFC